MKQNGGKPKKNLLFMVGGIAGVVTIIGLLIAVIQLFRDIAETNAQERLNSTLVAISERQLAAQQTLIALQQNSSSGQQITDIEATITALANEQLIAQATLADEDRFTLEPQPPSDSLNDGCINSITWSSLISSPINGQRNCLSIDSWGIIGKNDGLLISMNNLSDDIRQGIYTPIENGTQISFNLILSTLYTPKKDDLANLSIGVFSINSHDLESDPLLIYQKEDPSDGYPILVKMKERGDDSAYLYSNGKLIRYVEHSEQLITLDLSATNILTIYIDGNQVIQENLPFQDKVFWIGYRLPEKGQINAEISNFQIQEK